MSKKQKKLIQNVCNYVGEPVIVYDSSHKKLWQHPLHDQIILPGETHASGLRVWVQLNSDQGAYKGDYIFIFACGEPPEELYSFDEETEKGEINKEISREMISSMIIAMIEDVTTWGQAAFDEPHLTVARTICEAYLAKTLYVYWSPDCAICRMEDGIGYDT